MVPPAPPREPNANPALAERNFRLLWRGQALSLPASQMQNAAVLWHVASVAEPDERALALGWVGLARLVPILSLSLVGGLLADRYDRRKLMLATQAAMALSALALALLTLTGRAGLPAIYLCIGLGAAAAALEAPSRSSLVALLVPRAALANAISLNTSLYQLASVIGPASAGVVLVWLDAGWVYAINALSFAPVILGLLAMRDVPQLAADRRSAVSLAAMADGVRFVFGTPLLRGAMLLDFIAAVFASASFLLPLVAQDVLHVGPAGFSWLAAAGSLGAVLASWFLVRFESRVRRRGLALIGSIAVFGALTMLLGVSESYLLTFACLFGIGAADTVNMVLRNVIRQMHTPEHLRGRMSGITTFFSQGGPQLGELEAGLVAHRFGLVASIVSGGALCIAAGLWVGWKTPELREYGAAPPDPFEGRFAGTRARLGLVLGTALARRRL